MPSPPKTRPLTQRLLWFAAPWLGGVGAVAIVVRAAAVDRAEMKFLRQLYAVRPWQKSQVSQRGIRIACQRAIPEI
jgi:hypothetical protein